MKPKLVVGLLVGAFVLIGATGGHDALVNVGNAIRDVMHWITHDLFDWIATTWHQIINDNKAKKS